MVDWTDRESVIQYSESLGKSVSVHEADHRYYVGFTDKEESDRSFFKTIRVIHRTKPKDLRPTLVVLLSQLDVEGVEFAAFMDYLRKLSLSEYTQALTEAKEQVGMMFPEEPPEGICTLQGLSPDVVMLLPNC